MRFAEAYYLNYLWLAIFLVILFILAQKAKNSALKKFAEENLLKEIAFSVSPKRRVIKSALIVLIFVFSALSLARPQWGYSWQEVKRVGLDIMIAIDTSKSMLAEDVKPNRLTRSKLAVKDLLKKLKGDRIGLIAFSGTAFLQCPLTVDYGGFLLALNDLDVSTIPRGGTSISSAIKLALKNFEGEYKKFKILIIITDGEDHEGDSLNLAKKAATEEIKIYTIGIGTKEGDLISVKVESGKKTFLKDSEGNVVKSSLNEDLLRKIALTTGGMYVRSSGAEFGLDLIYEEKLSKMEKREIKEEIAKLYYERFQLFLAIALLFLLVEMCLNDRKKT